MKKPLFYAVVFAVCTTACKDDDAVPSFKLEDLIADWSLIASDIERDCANELLEIDEVEVTVSSSCDAGSSEFDFVYSFDGKQTLTSTDTDADLDYKIVILKLTSATLEIDWYYADVKMGTSSYEKL